MADLNFAQLSYSHHREHLARLMADPEKRKRAETWFREDTIDAWCHLRMYKTIDPLLIGNPGRDWLTVGDARWGKDARYIHERWQGLRYRYCAGPAGACPVHWIHSKIKL